MFESAAGTAGELLSLGVLALVGAAWAHLYDRHSRPRPVTTRATPPPR